MNTCTQVHLDTLEFIMTSMYNVVKTLFVPGSLSEIIWIFLCTLGCTFMQKGIMF